MVTTFCSQFKCRLEDKLTLVTSVINFTEYIFSFVSFPFIIPPYQFVGMGYVKSAKLWSFSSDSSSVTIWMMFYFEKVTTISFSLLRYNLLSTINYQLSTVALQTASSNSSNSRPSTSLAPLLPLSSI